MKTTFWLTLLGSLLLIATAIFHSTGYVPLLRRIEAGAIRPPLDGVLKSLWLTFSVQLLALAVIAFLARGMDRGGRIVLLCAASTGVTALLLLRFLGPFLGVYLLAAVALLFLFAGWLQAKNTD